MKEKELQIVRFEQAVALKKLGFDWETEWVYKENQELIRIILLNTCFNKNNYSAPTVAFALKWFRDVKGSVYSISFDKIKHKWDCLLGMDRVVIIATKSIKTYEQAESTLLDELLNLIEEEK